MAFLPVAPGLEPVLQAEAKELLPACSAKLRRGGIEVRVGMADLLRLVRLSRVAESVRVRVGRFGARDFRSLEAGLAKLGKSAADCTEVLAVGHAVGNLYEDADPTTLPRYSFLTLPFGVRRQLRIC